jgi:hypothetical protein
LFFAQNFVSFSQVNAPFDSIALFSSMYISAARSCFMRRNAQYVTPATVKSVLLLCRPVFFLAKLHITTAARLLAALNPKSI